MPSPFDPAFDDFPDTIPIFPLAGALLLPGGRLPLNIFEPRYLAMTLDALKDARMIGMIQPTGETSATGQPAVYRTGCLGRIIAFSETDDGRILITLAGLTRFDWLDELPLQSGYRRVRADYAAYRDDFDETEGAEFERELLLGALRSYLAQQSIEANWQAIEATEGARLVTSLAMTCPFAPSEKQALLEAPTVAERARVLTALLEMARSEGGGSA